MRCFDARALRQVLPNGLERSFFCPRARPSRKRVAWCKCNAAICISGSTVFANKEWPDFTTENGLADRRSFPPEVAIHLVKIACERPDEVGRSLSHWDCAELARQLIADDV